MRMRIFAVALLALLFGFSLAQTAGTGARLTAGPAYTGGDGKTEPRFPNVDVVFTLTGADGNPVVPKPGEIKLFSQGKEVGTAGSIRTFEQTGYGLTAILALDASGSMRGAPINAIHATISKFVNQARKQDRVEVITFADDTRTDVPFGASQSALTQELQTVQARGKFTRLYDGLLDALGQFNTSQPPRRQLVVISDGHDEGSQHTIADVVVKAKSFGVVIDSIGLNRDHGEYLTTLQQLSDQTGGTYRHALNAQDLETFMGQGIQATRATPVASIKTSNLPADNTLHSTQLRWIPGNLSATVFVRTPKSTAVQNFWIWGLAACFLAGVVLLAISWFGARSSAGRKPAASAPPAAVFQPPPVPPAFPSAPAPPFEAATGSFAQTQGGAGRTMTLPETGPAPSTFPSSTTPAPAPEPVGPQGGEFHPAKDLAQDARAERSRTKLAVFFEAPDKGPYARIAVKSGPLSGTIYPVTARTFSIGAVQGNDLILSGDPTISGQHARLFWEGAILKIEDQKSLNGTFINALRLTPGRHLLRPGDEIQLGQTKLTLDKA